MLEPRKVPLTVAERFVIQQLLPEKANFINMKLLRVLREDLVLSEEERTGIELVQTDDGRIKWDGEKAEKCIKEVPFESKAIVMVIDALTKLDKDETLEPQHLSLYEKFVEVPEKESDAEEKVLPM